MNLTTHVRLLILATALSSCCYAYSMDGEAFQLRNQTLERVTVHFTRQGQPGFEGRMARVKYTAHIEPGASTNDSFNRALQEWLQTHPKKRSNIVLTTREIEYPWDPDPNKPTVTILETTLKGQLKIASCRCEDDLDGSTS